MISHFTDSGKGCSMYSVCREILMLIFVIYRIR